MSFVLSDFSFDHHITISNIHKYCWIPKRFKRMEPFPTSLTKHSHSSTFQSSTEKRLRNYQANLNGVENPIKLRPILQKKKMPWAFCLVELFENYDCMAEFALSYSSNFTTESHFFTSLRKATHLFQEDRKQRIFSVRKGQLALERNVGKICPTVWEKMKDKFARIEHWPHINQSIVLQFDKHAGIFTVSSSSTHFMHVLSIKCPR